MTIESVINSIKISLNDNISPGPRTLQIWMQDLQQLQEPEQSSIYYLMRAELKKIYHAREELFKALKYLDAQRIAPKNLEELGISEIVKLSQWICDSHTLIKMGGLETKEAQEDE